MKTANIIILVVGIILIIVVLVIILYFAYGAIFGFKPVIPLPAGNMINFGLVVLDTNIPHYLQLSSQSNCNFQSINLSSQYNSADTYFKIIKDPSDNTKFALVNNQNSYLYLTSDSNYIDYISWDPNNTQAGQHNIWFTISKADSNNVYLQTADGRKLGLLAIGADQWSCYQGVQIGQNKYILAVNTSAAQQFYVTNQTTPILPPSVNYPFNDGDKVIIKSGNTNLVANCASISNSSFSPATQNNQWLAKMSPDKLAFALSVNGNYLKPTADNTGLLYFSANLSTLSDYQKGDYTNWFRLENNKLISLATNTALYYDQNTAQTCLIDKYYFTVGTYITAGDDVNIINV